MITSILWDSDKIKIDISENIYIIWMKVYDYK